MAACARVDAPTDGAARSLLPRSGRRIALPTAEEVSWVEATEVAPRFGGVDVWSRSSPSDRLGMGMEAGEGTDAGAIEQWRRGVELQGPLLRRTPARHLCVSRQFRSSRALQQPRQAKPVFNPFASTRPQPAVPVCVRHFQSRGRRAAHWAFEVRRGTGSR